MRAIQAVSVSMMRELMEKGYIKSMLFITHELPLLYNVTDDIMVMYAGQIVEKGTAECTERFSNACWILSCPAAPL